MKRVITPHFLALLLGLSSLYAQNTPRASTITESLPPWATVNVPGGYYMTDVDMVDRTVGFAVGDSGTILSTSNGGRNWDGALVVPRQLISDVTLRGVSANSRAKVVVVGDQGRIVRTTDGVHWTVDIVETGMDLQAVTWQNDTTVVAVGREEGFMPVVLRSTDAGASWSRISVPVQPNYGLMTVTTLRNGTVVAAGSIPADNALDRRAVFISSSDAGLTWRIDKTTLVPYIPLGLFETASGTLVCAGSNDDDRTGYFAAPEGLSSWRFVDVDSMSLTFDMAEDANGNLFSMGYQEIRTATSVVWEMREFVSNESGQWENRSLEKELIGSLRFDVAGDRIVVTHGYGAVRLRWNDWNQRSRPDVDSYIHLELGAVEVTSSVEVTVPVAVWNNSASAVTITAISFVDGSDVFGVVNAPIGSVIGPQQAIDLAVKFSPLDEGDHWGLLSIVSSTGEETHIVVSGTGVQPPQDGLVVSPFVHVSTTDEFFGHVTVSESVIRNTSDANVTIDDIAIVNGDLAAFWYEDWPAFPYTLRPGDELGLSIRFVPLDRGIHRAQLRVHFADGDTTTIPLIGYSRLVGFDDVIDFGVVPRGSFRDVTAGFMHSMLGDRVEDVHIQTQSPFGVLTVDRPDGSIFGDDVVTSILSVEPDDNGIFVRPLTVTFGDLLDGVVMRTLRYALRVRTSPTTDVQDSTGRTAMTVSPQPILDAMSIVLPTPDNGRASLRVLDLAGSIVYAESVMITNGTAHANVGALPPGVYNIVIETGTASKRSMIIKN